LRTTVAAPETVTRSAAAVPFWRYLNPVHLLRTTWRGRALIIQFTRRDIEGRYRSSLLGLAWSFVNPLVLLLVYTFVFGAVLKQRWPGAASDRLSEFGLVMFAGIIAYGLFSECVSRAPTLIVGVPNYVKRVVFPLELLPFSVLGSALFHTAVSFGVLLILHVAMGGGIAWTWLLIPVVLLPAVFISLGLLWAFASLGVFVRDLGYLVALVVQVLFFLTPVFYPIEAVPERVRRVIAWNPLASVVTGVRAAIFPGMTVPWTALLVSSALGLFLMMIGYAWFMRTRRSFGDVL
jgi:lipopolysaccharide transport system permease protein